MEWSHERTKEVPSSSVPFHFRIKSDDLPNLISYRLFFLLHHSPIHQSSRRILSTIMASSLHSLFPAIRTVTVSFSELQVSESQVVIDETKLIYWTPFFLNHFVGIMWSESACCLNCLFLMTILHDIYKLMMFQMFLCFGGIWCTQDRNVDLSMKIEEGFGPKGLGILSVTDVRYTYTVICCLFLYLLLSLTLFFFNWILMA